MKNSVFTFFCISFFLIISSSAFALVGDWEGSSYNVYVALEPGKTADIDKFIWAVNNNDVEVEVYLMALGDLNNVVEIIENPIKISPNNKAKVRFKIMVDTPGIYSGKFSGLFFAPGQKSITSMSPNILIDVYDKNTPPDSVVQKSPQSGNNNADVVEEYLGDDGTSITTDDLDEDVEDNSVEDTEDDTLDAATLQPTNEDSTTASTSNKISGFVTNVDSVRGGRSANPWVGILVFFVIVTIGCTGLYYLFIKK